MSYLNSYRQIVKSFFIVENDAGKSFSIPIFPRKLLV
jgi:hypothetical protein